MPVFAKFDGVDGESTDHFEFKKASGADDFVSNDGDTSPDPMAGLLLPAVQSVREAPSSLPPSSADAGEEITICYTEIEWTY